MNRIEIEDSLIEGYEGINELLKTEDAPLSEKEAEKLEEISSLLYDLSLSFRYEQGETFTDEA